MYNKEGIFKYIEEQQQTFIDISDAIWGYAELAYHEEHSAAILMEALEAEGFEVESGLAGIPTAFRASYGTGHPIIGILGEYDALDGLSQVAGVSERQPLSIGGAGHGCGHNCLGSGALAGAIGVKKYLENNPLISGTIVYFGCPGEEGKSGKTFMAREGVFDRMDCALTWHPYGTNNIFSGTTLANVNIIFNFKGVASHAGASPELGRSALDAAELMNIGVQFLREHIPDSARIHYAFLDAGGKAPNVVQEKASLLYKIRSPRTEDVVELKERVIRIAQGAAMMTDTLVSMEYHAAASNIIPNAVLEKVVQKNMEDIGAPVYTHAEERFAKDIVASYELPEKSVDLAARLSPVWGRILEEHYAAHGVGINNMVLPYQHWDNVTAASTDVGDVSWICPTTMFFTQCAAAKITEHSWQYVACNATSLAHKGLIFAGKILAGSAIDILENPKLVEEAWTDYEQYLKGRSYRCPLYPGEKPRL